MGKGNVYMASKPRYEILDGLRGVAALMVVMFHLFETYSHGPATQIINHGYLAVDFFFVLSGFVIGYAYDDRWDRMTVRGFFRRRLTRLHPMVIAGTLIGAVLFFFAGTAFPRTMEVSGWKFALCLVMGLLMIPCGTGLDIRGWGETNSFNGPNWSLTYEYAANILYALIFRRLPKTTDAKSTAVCKWLGEISYPLYITHFPLIYMQINWAAEHADAPLWQHIVVATGVFFLSIVLARGLLKVYDEPVREWLKNHWLKK